MYLLETYKTSKWIWKVTEDGFVLITFDVKESVSIWDRPYVTTNNGVEVICRHATVPGFLWPWTDISISAHRLNRRGWDILTNDEFFLEQI